MFSRDQNTGANMTIARQPVPIPLPRPLTSLHAIPAATFAFSVSTTTPSSAPRSETSSRGPATPSSWRVTERRGSTSPSRTARSRPSGSRPARIKRLRQVRPVQERSVSRPHSHSDLDPSQQRRTESFSLRRWGLVCPPENRSPGETPGLRSERPEHVKTSQTPSGSPRPPHPLEGPKADF